MSRLKTELNIEEVRNLLTWMEDNQVKDALITQDVSSGIGTATVVVDFASKL